MKEKSKEIVVKTMTMPDSVINNDSLREPLALGAVFAMSGMFPDVKSQAQAMVKILAGRELGIAPLEAMTNVYMVNNQLAISSKLMSALIKRSNKYDYRISKLDETECTLTFFTTNVEGMKEEIGKSTFTIKDAAKAGIVNKDNWKNYPRNMLFARALSNGAKWFCTDMVSAGYVIEELTDVAAKSSIVEMDKKGNVKNGEESV